MAKDKTTEKPFIRTLPGKLAALIGGGLAALNGAPALDATPVLPDNSNANARYEPAASITKPLPEKLILRQAGTGFKMIAQHDSHSSHSSHTSHSSHSSHGSHSSHSSHSSHVSGGI